MKKTISEKKADPVPSKKLLMAAVIFIHCGEDLRDGCKGGCGRWLGGAGAAF